jgi:transcriptional antiterminator NusG
MAMKWYVVHTYSGHENKAKLSLQDRVRQHALQAKFGDVLIPTDTVVELVKGQKRSTTRKFFPGYIFVQMDLDQETFHLVKNTPKITGLPGRHQPAAREGNRDPEPARRHDRRGIPAEAAHVVRGDRDGAGDRRPVRELHRDGGRGEAEKQKVRVNVSIFGRATPVELDFAQVEKS